MPETNSFLVCRFWSRSMPTQAERRARMANMNPEMARWLGEEPCLGHYELRLEAINSEYDTGLIEWEMTIVYDHPADAFQHRMRWD